MKALIGYTGFVGQNLEKASSKPYDDQFNSKNISEIEGKSYDEIVCAGVSAVKWAANKYPFDDAHALNTLVQCLKKVKAKHFILISTIDVYRDPLGVTERDKPPIKDLHFYGLHRLKFERFIQENFPKVTIIRLPGLFGPGLRKNLIFDLIHDNDVHKIDPAGRLQWYPVGRLSSDIDAIVRSGASLVNISPEPILTSEIATRFFPRIEIGKPAKRSPAYDMQTIHAELLGGIDQYHLSKENVLMEMKKFISSEVQHS